MNKPEKAQSSINERLKFLIGALNLSARAFSARLGVSDSNTRNYLGKGTKPSSDYLESIAVHFSHVSLNWLITGQGEPFLLDSSNPTQARESNVTYTKNFSGNSVGLNRGNANQQSNTVAPTTEALQREVELLKAQLADKERTIQILLSHQSKP